MWLMWLATLAGFPGRSRARPRASSPASCSRSHGGRSRSRVLLSAAWWVLVLRAERSTLRSQTYWTAGMTLIWGLAATLWLDWIDYGKTYRPVAAEPAQGAAAGRPAASRAAASARRNAPCSTITPGW